MLPIETSVRAYEDKYGKSPFETWFSRLGPVAAAKVTVALARLEQGNLSNVKSLGAGVHELKVNHGPGYRVYFGKDSNTVIILVGGGTKKRQEADIKAARLRWADYKARKKKVK
ncbi:MAG: type II toxin-antitoxin system RelE/ParE family toxin [Myxococcales bacterium]|nr:type II toxin-antitoxin system RelE/ParE family toxin [Myxococcales bacterium]